MSKTELPNLSKGRTPTAPALRDYVVPKEVYEAMMSVGRYPRNPPSEALATLSRYYKEQRSLPRARPARQNRGPRPSVRDGLLLDQICDRIIECVIPKEINLTKFIREVVGPSCHEADIKRYTRYLENEGLWPPEVIWDASENASDRLERAVVRKAKKKGQHLWAEGQEEG